MDIRTYLYMDYNVHHQYRRVPTCTNDHAHTACRHADALNHNQNIVYLHHIHSHLSIHQHTSNTATTFLQSNLSSLIHSTSVPLDAFAAGQQRSQQMCSWSHAALGPYSGPKTHVVLRALGSYLPCLWVPSPTLQPTPPRNLPPRFLLRPLPYCLPARHGQALSPQCREHKRTTITATTDLRSNSLAAPQMHLPTSTTHIDTTSATALAT